MTDYDGMAISFGAGVNSVAMTIMLVNDGWHGPIVFSDTGCEWPETICYMDYFEEEWLKPRGLEIVRLAGMPWQRKAQGRSLIEYCEQDHIIPMAAVRWCTIGWKVEPIGRWCEANGIEHDLLGIAADESHRQKDRVRPLVDEGVTRKGCIEIIKAEGLDVPQKSGCYICPFQRNDQWYELWRRHPELFNRAMGIEEGTKRAEAGRTRATLDVAGKVTLRQRLMSYENQIELPGFDMDDLLEYKPCVCGL